MKYHPLLLVVAFAFTSCTTVDLERGRLTTMGDSQNLTMTHKGDSIHWDAMGHSVIWDASGRFVGNVAAGVADAMIANGVAHAVAHGATNGVQLIAAAAPSVVQKSTSRKTNRSTPKPSQRVIVSPSGQVIRPNVP